MLLDTYFQLKHITEKSEKRHIINELSCNMRSLPFFPEYSDNPEFRSYAGMQMCLANVGYIDPENPSKFGHGSALQKRIFNRYFDCREELHKLSKAITYASKEKFPIDYSFENSDFGILVPSYHIFLERNNKSVIAVKHEMQICNQACCKICGQDLTMMYGKNNLMEVHIDLPLHKNVSGVIISPSDLICICPTCHKLAHSELESFEVQHLKKLIVRR